MNGKITNTAITIKANNITIKNTKTTVISIRSGETLSTVPVHFRRGRRILKRIKIQKRT